MKYRAFLTHNWGTRQPDGTFDVHERVLKIATGLQAKGYQVLIDAERTTGATFEQMCDGIDDSEVVVVFVTQTYIDKVRGSNKSDNCQYEFNYAKNEKTKAKMVAVVLEEACRKSNKWKGPVGNCLGGEGYVDFCSDDDFDAKITQIGTEIDRRIDNWVSAAVGCFFPAMTAVAALDCAALDCVPVEKAAAPTEAPKKVIVPLSRRYIVKTHAEIRDNEVKPLPWGIRKRPVGRRIYEAAGKGDMAALLPLVDKWFANDVLNWANPADNMRTALHVGSAAAVELLASAPGIDINQGDKGGSSAIMLASVAGHTEVVKALIAAPGIDLNKTNNNGWTVIMLPAREGHAEIVGALLATPGINLNKINNDGWTAVMIAAFNGHTEVVRAFLATPGIDILRKVAPSEKARLVGKTALDMAVANNKTETAALLREPTAERSRQQKGAEKLIYDAAWVGNMAALKPLVKEWSGNYEVLNWANPFGVTPLIIGSHCGKVEAVRLLLATPGIDVNKANKNGRTAIMWAAGSGHTDIVRALLAAPGIDLNKRATGGDYKGKTALGLAMEENKSEIAALLRAAGAME